MKNIIITLALSLLSFTSFSQIPLLIEGFEGSEFPPTNWELKTSSSLSQIPYEYDFTNYYENWFMLDPSTMSWGSQYVHSGGKSSGVGASPYEDDYTYSWLITNPINIPDSNLIELKHWMWYKMASNKPTHLYIMINEIDNTSRDDGNDDTPWEMLYDYNFEDSHYFDQEWVTDLSAYANKTIQIAFVHFSTYQMSIDDILLEASNPSTTEIKSITESNIPFKVFPNPTKNFINIKFENSDYTDASINVFDITGKLLSSTKNFNILNNQYQLDCSGYKEGLYMIQVKTNNQVYTSKVHVKK
jgi:hypothetical protein